MIWKKQTSELTNTMISRCLLVAISIVVIIAGFACTNTNKPSDKQGAADLQKTNEISPIQSNALTDTDLALISKTLAKISSTHSGIPHTLNPLTMKLDQPVANEKGWTSSIVERVTNFVDESSAISLCENNSKSHNLIGQLQELYGFKFRKNVTVDLKTIMEAPGKDTSFQVSLSVPGYSKMKDVAVILTTIRGFGKMAGAYCSVFILERQQDEWSVINEHILQRE
ncbi:hypothetical protein [uncultured Gimesia sp.]|uniref:hypothetical protein n=1 Tax=uncultured Gimesia sp. TaxID=1678688 RepID=UPI00261C32A4|nr:hypothetical protein [uncultured Gimesia sp.]